jgi:(2Fe-2S) ferredoxin
MAYYQQHVLFCVNQKAEGKVCCANGDSQALFNYAREKLQALDLHGAGKIRVSHTGCLGRCALGPCVVVYPQGVWYRISTPAEVDRLISEHLQGGEVVTQLLLQED